MLFAALGLGLLVGCAGRRPPAPAAAGPTVRKIKFEGNGGLFSSRSDFSLRGGMEQGQNPALVGLIRPRRRRVYLDSDVLALDAWRLEVWYAHHGYFDAQVSSWDIQRVRKKRRFLFWDLPEAVRVVGHVDEGRPYTVASLSWEGVKPLGGPAAARLRNDADLAEGDVFTLAALTATQDLTLSFLQDQSYAYAEVMPKVDVFPRRGRTVDVVLGVTLGPACTFGEVTVSGLKDVPERLVRAELPIQPVAQGDKPQPFSSSTLASTRRRLFGLGVFSVVNVVPELQDAAAPEEDGPLDPKADVVRAPRPPTGPTSVVPVRISLSESNFRQMRLGGGVQLEGGLQEGHVSADFSHSNLFGRLINLNWNNRVGYAIWLSQADLLSTGLSQLPDTRGPVVDSQVLLAFPHFPGRGWRLTTDIRYELGVEQGYRFSSPSTSPTLQWRATDRISVELGYQLRFFDYIDLQLEESDFGRTPLGLDFSDPYLLSYLRQKLTYSSRDDLLFPRRGLYAEYELAEAGGPAGGQFNFLRLTADQRAYLPIIRIGGWRPSGALAFRVGGGGILPYGDETGARVPYAERLYLGGASDVRGWQSNRLGPYICNPDSGVSCASSSGQVRPTVAGPTGTTGTYADVIPIGGLVSLFGSVELRLYTDLDLGFAIFTDAGMVWEQLEDAIPPLVLPSTGAGLRYRMPFGVIRLDVARRMTQPDIFVGEPLWNVHFGLSEAY
jgi:outer membrane protein assembly factor BamA